MSVSVFGDFQCMVLEWYNSCISGTLNVCVNCFNYALTFFVTDESTQAQFLEMDSVGKRKYSSYNAVYIICTVDIFSKLLIICLVRMTVQLWFKVCSIRVIEQALSTK